MQIDMLCKLPRIFASLAMLFAASGAAAALPQAVDDKALPSLAPMLERITPAVVNIATEGRIQLKQNPLFNDPFFRRFFNMPDQPLQRKTQSLGSGVIVDAARGLVLTNNHVVKNAIEITVTLRDGRQFQAEKIGTDPETDVALIKIAADNLVALPSSDSDKLRVGDFVVAIGNPFGLGQTVTSGIVSALSRSGLGIEGYEDFIQTDASINPGNSGGALVNLRGELVGINTAIFSRTGGNIGIGFAIPINLALQITDQLLNKGTVERGFVGIRVQDLNPDLAEAFGITQKSGAVINSILPDSPAGQAGLQAGDIIIAINRKPVKQASDVRNHIGLLQVNDAVEFDLLRGGGKLKLTAYVAANSAAAANPPPEAIGQAVNPRLKGVTLSEIDRTHRLYGEVRGVVIVDMQPDTAAWDAGLRPGDVITAVNRRDVRDLRDFLTAVDNPQGALLLRVLRGNLAAFLVLK